MDKYTQYKLKITDKGKELVKIYLQKMKKFVEKYNIEKELYNDIEEMVFEKLSNQKKLDQFSITKVLKEV
jgi:predicted transcriptional regulator